MSKINEILSEALALESTEKLQLIDKILASFYPVSKGVSEYVTCRISSLPKMLYTR